MDPAFEKFIDIEMETQGMLTRTSIEYLVIKAEHFKEHGWFKAAHVCEWGIKWISKCPVRI